MAPVEITLATPDRVSVLASVFGRAWVTEPVAIWGLGFEGDLEERLIRAFEDFLEALIPLGMVWEAGRGMGAAVWIPPDRPDAWEAQARFIGHAPPGEGERRFDVLWSWVESKIPDEPLWNLDSLAVDPTLQGRGIGSALIEFGLAQVGEAGVFLETGTARNVPLYQRFGFRVVEDADAPDGGPHVWFMRRDP